MAEGRHISNAEIEEMERRKRAAPEMGEGAAGEPQTGDHEQEADRNAAQKDTHLVDPVITGSPD